MTDRADILAYATTSENEITGLARILGDSFGYPHEKSVNWIKRFDPAWTRVLRDNRSGELVAGLGIIDMGLFICGHPVRTAGIAGVGVAPEYRGRGSARRIMEETLREMRLLGFPTSSLYPATMTLYRKVGYERAGTRHRIKLPTAAIRLPKFESDLRIAPIRDEDHEALAECYRRRAAMSNGFLDRARYNWDRIRHARGRVPHGFAVWSADNIQGFLMYLREPEEGAPFSLLLVDLIAATPEAGLTLLRFLAEHRSITREITWFGSPDDPLLALMIERPNEATVELDLIWMLRILDVPAALEGRRYPAGLDARLQLDIEDDLFAENCGPWTLIVSDGVGHVEPGGSGLLKLDIRALATLYTGFQSPWQLQLSGSLHGADEDALQLAGAIFAAPAPWMPDMF